MMPESQAVEYPFTVTLETETGQSVAVPVASLTRAEVAQLLQHDFKRLVQEAGVRGARVHVQQAPTADYEDVLAGVAAGLRRSVTPRAA